MSETTAEMLSWYTKQILEQIKGGIDAFNEGKGNWKADYPLEINIILEGVTFTIPCFYHTKEQ